MIRSVMNRADWTILLVLAVMLLPLFPSRGDLLTGHLSAEPIFGAAA